MPSNVERRSTPDAQLETRADDASPPVVSGHASVFDTWYTLYDSPTLQIRERVLPGAFRYAIDSGQDVHLLQDHNPSLILGRTGAGLSLAEDSVGLHFECALPATTLGRDVAELVRLGIIRQCSFAFKPRVGGESITTTALDGGKSLQSIEVSDVDLYDVTLTANPASPSTDVSVRTRQLIDAHAARRRRLADSRRKLNQIRVARLTLIGPAGK
jgi:HK97 family phage prohead protease